MNISHDVEFKEQIKAIERMAKRWFKEFGHFRVTFETIGEEEIGSAEKLVFKEDGPFLGAPLSKNKKNIRILFWGRAGAPVRRGASQPGRVGGAGDPEKRTN